MTPSGLRRVTVRYDGEVQGVGFRFTAMRLATECGVTGGEISNAFDGSVRLVAEGREEDLRRLLLQIRRSRLGAMITDEQIEWSTARGLTVFDLR